MGRPDVRRDLCLFDVVVAKLDAPSEELFRAINRPVDGVVFEEVLEGLVRLREAFRGRLALPSMFLDRNERCAQELASLARRLHADEVHVNTPLRPCPVDPLPRPVLEKIEEAFSGLCVRNVYRAWRSEPGTLEDAPTRRRRPLESR